MTRSVLTRLAVGVVVLLLGTGGGHGEIIHPPLVEPQPLTGRDAMQGVYVRDSAVAVERLALAARMESLRQWDTSADVYQEILRDYADRVVPSQVDQDNTIYQYTSVVQSVHQRLSRWPAEGLAVYRARYEPAASALLESAGPEDVATLHRVVNDYFATPSAGQAGLRLVDLHLQSGEFAAALWMALRLLEWHPDLGELRPQLLYRAAVAQHLLGYTQSAQELGANLRRDFAQARGVVRGEQVNLADSLERELSGSSPLRTVWSGDSWPMDFGSPDRSRIPSVSGRGGARLFSIPLAPSPTRNVPHAAARRDLEMFQRRDRAAGVLTGIVPAIDRGEMFFQDNARIYAVSLESGMPLPGWLATHGGERQGRYTINAWAMPRGISLSVTLTSDSVLAVLGQPDNLAMGLSGQAGRADTRLVCLNRTNGTERWVVLPRDLPENLRGIQFSGSPLVAGDSVFIAARGSKGAQFEDAYVLSFDLASGSLRWISYLASANAVLQPWDESSSIGGPTLSQLAHAGGRLYVLTNIGALACLDAHTGTIVWINLYPRQFNPQMLARQGWIRPGAQPPVSRKPWETNPPILQGGNVFVLPSDGRHLHVYDAGSGREIKRLPLTLRIPVAGRGESDENITCLAGVVDDKLIVASHRSVFALRWASFDPEKSRAHNFAWYKSFSRERQPNDSIRGRPFITTDSVLVSTTWAMHRVALDSGMTLDTYPTSGQWGDQEEPGNIVATAERLIIAGPERVNVYTDVQLAMRRLDAAVAAAPHDPSVRLNYAQMLFVAGNASGAMEKLDEAIHLIASSSKPPSTARTHVFTTAMTFAHKAVTQEAVPPDLIAGLFDRAALMADTPNEHVSWRLARAFWARRTGQHELELDLYQQILLDPSLRTVLLLSGEAQGATPAGQLARQRIDELLRQTGRSLYAGYEHKAEASLRQAQATGNTQALLEVADSYPNARAAVQALQAAAQGYESVGAHRQAVQVWRRVYFEQPSDAQRLPVLEALARNYAALPGGLAMAWSRLEQAAQINPQARLTQPIRLPDGQVVEHLDLTQVVLTLGEMVERERPQRLVRLQLPLSGAGRLQPTFLDRNPPALQQRVQRLVLPMEGFERHDRLVFYTQDQGLGVMRVNGDDVKFLGNPFGTAPDGLAWLDEHLLLWAGPLAMLINEQDGSTVWQTRLEVLPELTTVLLEDASAPENSENERETDLPAHMQARIQADAIANLRAQRLIRMAPAVDGAVEPQASVERIVEVFPLNDRIILTTTTGRVLAVAVVDGTLLWQTRITDRKADRVVANNDFIVLRLVDEQSVRLVVLDTWSGLMTASRSFRGDASTPGVPINIALADDGTLVYLTPERLCAIDLFDPGHDLRRIKHLTPVVRRGEGTALFAGSTDPQHLMIQGRRILAVCEGGQRVRVFDLRTGLLLRHGDVEAAYSTGASTGSRLILHSVGDMLYAVGSGQVLAYDLNDPTRNWTGTSSAQPLTPRDLIVGDEHLLLIAEPTEIAGARRHPGRAPRVLHLHAYRRTPVSPARPRESGLLDHVFELTDASGISAWQAVDGGLFYLAGDQNLYYLRGGRTAE